MKKSHKKMISEIMNGINWKKIHSLYKDGYLNWTQEIEVDGVKTFSYEVPSLKDLKDELRIILNYVVNNNIDVYYYSHWSTFFNCDDNDFKLEVLFTPIRFYISEKDMEFLNSEITHEYIGISTMSTEQEIDMLKEHLKEAEKEQKFELCSKLRDKIIQLTNDKG